VAGVVVGSGLLLAFTLKEDKFDFLLYFCIYIQFGRFFKGRGHGMPKINSVGWHTYHHKKLSI
jgi:hypothetical protein